MTIELKRAATFCAVKKDMFAQMSAKLMKRTSIHIHMVRAKATLMEMKDNLTFPDKKGNQF